MVKALSEKEAGMGDARRFSLAKLSGGFGPFAQFCVDIMISRQFDMSFCIIL